MDHPHAVRDVIHFGIEFEHRSIATLLGAGPLLDQGGHGSDGRKPGQGLPGKTDGRSQIGVRVRINGQNLLSFSSQNPGHDPCQRCFSNPTLSRNRNFHLILPCLSYLKKA